MSNQLSAEQLARIKASSPETEAEAALLAHIDVITQDRDKWEKVAISRRKERDIQAATIQRVRDLHPREVAARHPGYGDEVYCPECKLHSPCNTQFALDRGDA